MRTEYDLHQWTVDGNRAGTRRFPDLGAAMLATGYGNRSDWRDAPGGALFLKPEIATALGYAYGQPWDTVPWAIYEVAVAENDAERILLAIKVALDFGQTDGAHHKMWVIDQMMRVLAGDRYEALIVEYREDGEYSWDEGIAP